MPEFAGERYLAVDVPDYDAECASLIKLMLAVAVFWVVIFPVCLSQTVEEQNRAETEPVVEVTGKKDKKHQRRKPVTVPTAYPKDPVRSVPLWVNLVATAGCLLSGIALILFESPYNTYLPRRVFSIPVLTEAECDTVWHMAEAAAARNLENVTDAEDPLASDPKGWQKKRHSRYPTTDLNLVTDPFMEDNLQWLSHKLNQRLAPALSRIFGIVPSSIRAIDLFVVRYDAEWRALLSNHTDTGDLSFNILLRNDFTGGGTRFWHRASATPFANVEPRKGHALAHSALIHHEGVAIDSGTRAILVGFLSIDANDPFTGAPTGLSWWASWCNLQWLVRRFGYGYEAAIQGDQSHWTHHLKGLFYDGVGLLTAWLDTMLEHEVEVLISDNKVDAYLQALDQTPLPSRQAEWFTGQQINIGVHGRIDSEWATRSRHADRFTQLPHRTSTAS